MAWEIMPLTLQTEPSQSLSDDIGINWHANTHTPGDTNQLNDCSLAKYFHAADVNLWHDKLAAKNVNLQFLQQSSTIAWLQRVMGAKMETIWHIRWHQSSNRRSTAVISGRQELYNEVRVQF